MNTKGNYSFLNRMAKGNGIVLWGSSSLNGSYINELLQDYQVTKRIYNRSIPGLTLGEAEQYLESCVYELRPSRVIINLGEEDVKATSDIEKLIEQYRWILYKIHVRLPKCQMVLTTIPNRGEVCERFNEELKKLAGEIGCTFYRVPPVTEEEEYGAVFLSTVKLSLYESSLAYSGIASKAVFDLMMQ